MTTSSGTAFVNPSGNGVSADYILLQDQKTNGTAGGASTAGSWQTRVLNTEVTDVGEHASLSSNQFTLAAGTYRISASAPGKKSGRYRIKLRNISDSADTLLGSNSYSATADNVSTHAFVNGEFTIAASKIFELQYRMEFGSASDGLGQDSSFGVTEIYGQVELFKIA